MSDPANITVKTKNKTLAVFIDGTWNVNENNTNVWRLYSSCAREDRSGRKQLSYYSKGVGTSYGQVIRGGMFGFGIDTLIKDAYEWLIANYDDNRDDDKAPITDADLADRDRLFIFGFSRGAYAARSLAGLVARWGLPQPGSPIGVGELYAKALSGTDKTLYSLKRKGDPADPLEEWVIRYCRPVDITMVGVWDTVGALRGAAGYRETGLRLPIKHLFQALAIDEHRPSFAPTLWTVNRTAPPPAPAPAPTPSPDVSGIAAKDAAVASPSAPSAPPGFKSIPLERVEQRWFCGAHANVGGGYNSDLLPQLSLQWIMEKAGALDMAFRAAVDIRGADQPDAVYTSPIADSFRTMGGGAYYALKLGRPYLRPIGALPGPGDSALNVNETIDRSVFERWRRDPDYRPPNLDAWVRRLARGVAIEDLTASVSAFDPGRPLGSGAEGPALRPAPAF